MSTLARHKRLVHSVKISADGKRVFSGSDDETVKIWNVETGAEVRGDCSVEGGYLGAGGVCLTFRSGSGFGAI